ncbi:MAG TPA: hypothetical protein VGG16_11945 [Streptosporangiaceae bacterium]
MAGALNDHEGPVARRAVSRGIEAIFSSVRSSQQIPAAGRWWPALHVMTRSGVTMMSTGTSCPVTGIFPAGSSCGSCADRRGLAR